MGILNNSDEVSLINVKLTRKGRELIARGFKTDNVFDIVKFSLGDSEVNYRLDSVDSILIMKPEIEDLELKSKLYVSGVIPSGTSSVNLSPTTISMSRMESDISVAASTYWPPISSPTTGGYNEKYVWTNLGPLNDYDFNMVLSNDTTVASFQTFDVSGTTKIKVRGQTSGSYEVLTLNII